MEIDGSVLVLSEKEQSRKHLSLEDIRRALLIN